jgi:hypothetical protein
MTSIGFTIGGSLGNRVAKKEVQDTKGFVASGLNLLVSKFAIHADFFGFIQFSQPNNPGQWVVTLVQQVPIKTDN